MACFAVPLAEAVVTSIITKYVKSKEQKTNNTESFELSKSFKQKETPLSKKLKWLSTMLYGGSALLAFEHLWHGEISAFFPFLTAAESYESTVAMLQEMATAGVGMSLLVTGVWLTLAIFTRFAEKKAAKGVSINVEAFE